MKVKYGLLAIFLGLVYGIVLEFLPDFPVSQGTLLALLIYALGKFGVEVVEQPLFRLFGK